MAIARRGFLGLLGAGSAAPALAQGADRGPVRFAHGVASGDPLQDRVVIWTRITSDEPSGRPVAFEWRLTPLGGGRGLSGTGVTGPERDYTVKVDAAGLQPGREYRFHFVANGVRSPEGRTRTLPQGALDEAVLAIASCSLYPNGYFNAYQAIADLPRVDAVLHLGDYIYEYGGPGTYGMSSPVAAERPHDPPHEIVSLDDYRRRHAQYKSDPHLQAAHARAPWIVVWDDHETTNDSWRDGAQNHQPEEGDWSARKAAALKAYFEWMPIREGAGGATDAIQRSFRFGDLFSLIMLETRLSARDLQLDYERDMPVVDGVPDVEGFRRRLADPSRRLMGADQEAWLAGELAASAAAGHAWQVIGNQVVMGRIASPSLSRLVGEAEAQRLAAASSEATRGRIARLEELAAADLPYGLDMWNGYPAARERLYGIFQNAGARPIVVSGDSHAFWVNDLANAAGERVAVEFGATSVTSPGGADVVPELPIGELFARASEEVLFNDQASKGFLLLTLRRHEAVAELRAVSTIHARAFETSVLKRFRVAPEGRGLTAPREA